MHTTYTFELAMTACAYRLEQVFYTKDSTRKVRQIHGLVPITKRITIDGQRKTIVNWKKYRWNDAGECLSRYSNKRQRKYDLPLRTIEESSKQKEALEPSNTNARIK